ncbi:MAG: hypothetical protein V4808_07225 [Pseudomonadota bacterium]
MFNVDAKPTFIRTVTVKVPNGEGHSEQTFKAEFQALDNDEVAKFNFNVATETTAFLENVILSFDDVSGSDDKPIAYSIELRDRVLKKQWARLGLLRAYYAGVAAAAEGN